MAFRGARWWPLDELAEHAAARRPGDPALAGASSCRRCWRAAGRPRWPPTAHRHGRARRRRSSGSRDAGGSWPAPAARPASRLGPECVPRWFGRPTHPWPRSTSGKLLGAISISGVDRALPSPKVRRSDCAKKTADVARRSAVPAVRLRRAGAYSSRLGAPPPRTRSPGEAGWPGWRPPAAGGCAPRWRPGPPWPPPW